MMDAGCLRGVRYEMALRVAAVLVLSLAVYKPDSEAA